MGDAEVVDLRTTQIKRLLDQADQKSAEESALRWDAARLLAEEAATGKSQRDLAAEVGRSQTYVRYSIEIWEKNRAENYNFQRSDKVTFQKLLDVYFNVRAQDRDRVIATMLKTGESRAAIKKREKQERKSNVKPRERLAEPAPGTRKFEVREEVIRSGANGATEKEIAARIGVSQQGIWHLREELVQEEWIVDGGDRRGKPPATVWLLSTAGAEKLGVAGGWESAVDLVGRPKTVAERRAARVFELLEDPATRRAVESAPLSAGKAAQLARSKAREKERESKRADRERLEEAKRQAAAKVGDPCEPAYKLFAELVDMHIRLSMFMPLLREAPSVFATRQAELVELADDVANAAFDISDELKKPIDPSVVDVVERKRQALPHPASSPPSAS